MTRTSSSAAVIAVRKIASAVVHAAPQSGTWQGARLFERTACGIEIRANGEWQEVSADEVRNAVANETPHYMSDYEMRVCKRCAAQSPDGGMWRIISGEDEPLPAITEIWPEDGGDPDAYASDEIVANVEPLPDSGLRPEFETGERVGIVRGVQSIKGPHVYAFGTVVAAREFWRGSLSYIVVQDGDSEEYVWESYLLRHIPAVPGDPAPGPRNCTHSWHAGDDGFPLCRDEECSGLTVACGQGLTACLRHTDRPVPVWAQQLQERAREALAAVQRPEEAQEDLGAAFRRCADCGGWMDGTHGFGECPNVSPTREFTADEFDAVAFAIAQAVERIRPLYRLNVSADVVSRIADDAANALSRYGIRR